MPSRKTAVGNKAAQKGQESPEHKQARIYKRLVSAGVIAPSKDNATIPPLNRGHKSALTKALKNHHVAALANQPSTCVAFRLKDPQRVKLAASYMGLESRVVGHALLMRVERHCHAYFNERHLRFTVDNPATGQRIIAYFDDWKSRVYNRDVPEIKLTPRFKGTDMRDKAGKLLKRSSNVAAFSPIHCWSMSDPLPVTQYLKEGHRYVEEVIMTIPGHEAIGICYVQQLEDYRRPYTAEIRERDNKLKIRLAKTSDYRKR